MRWQVQICNPLFKPDTVIEYLGRYVNRTAISNSRIKSYDGEFVEFTYKDYKENSKIKTMKLKDTEFLARFARHIPPAHFTRIRHYGFLGNSAKEKLARVKELTGSPDIVCERTTDEILREKRGENYLLCKKCQGETVVEHEEHKPWWTREFIVRRLGELKENRQNHPFLTAKRGVQIVSEKD